MFRVDESRAITDDLVEAAVSFPHYLAYRVYDPRVWLIVRDSKKQAHDQQKRGRNRYARRWRICPSLCSAAHKFLHVAQALFIVAGMKQ